MSLSTDSVVSLLISQLISLVAADSKLLFEEVGDFDALESRVTAIAQGCYIGPLNDVNLGTNSRLVLDETYGAIVNCKKGSEDDRKVNALCDTVRDALNGIESEAEGLMPFRYQGKRIVERQGEYTVYELDFTCTRALEILYP